MESTKKKILFVTPYPFGKAPSQRFRFEQYWNILSENHELKLASFWNDKSWDILYYPSHKFQKFFHLIAGFTKRIMLLFYLKKYDYIFIHREAAPIGLPFFEWITTKILRKKTIFDFDDAIWLPNVSQSNKFAIFFKANWKTKKIAKWATTVSCGNKFLAEFISKYNNEVKIIPTTIDTEKVHTIKHKTCTTNKKTITIGWTGTVTTLNHLDIIIPVIQKLEKNYNIIFKVICNKNPEYKLNSFEYTKWNKQTEISDLLTFDIGIMPLPDNEWSKGKCGFKGLQYMALEIAPVMSPVGVNTEIISNGTNGLLANNNKEWYNALSSLIESEKLRKKLGKAARKSVIDKYSVKANYEKYFELFK